MYILQYAVVSCRRARPNRIDAVRSGNGCITCWLMGESKKPANSDWFCKSMPYGDFVVRS